MGGKKEIYKYIRFFHGALQLSRTERPRKINFGTEVAHVTRDSDTTFKVKRSTWCWCLK